ncbi:Protein scd2/ral3 [Sphaceloma murrayae]|uniref:Protein scd2/ral3 n=1 Tax=Sphaceloma murrayae TaxID=2082308 RepID=A0A2K1QT31_9PEZI|nr:Protein scd2/ral3 [Sphaceloma murrayae]
MAFKASQQMSFVTVTSLDDFKSRENVRKVRKTVMKDYLDKAKDDPSSTDRRATRKRSASSPRSLVANMQQRCTGAFRSLLPSPPQSHYDHSPPSHGPTSPRPTIHAFDQDDATGTASHSSSPKPADLLTPRSDLDINRSKSDCSTAFFAEAPDPGLEMEQYFEEYTRAQGSSSIAADTEWLRHSCIRFFRTKGMTERLVPLFFTSPLAYIGRLCITAPYQDIMVSRRPDGEKWPDQDIRLTLEIFDVFPRMVNDTLNDPAERCSDGTILAIVELCYGQLFTPYLGLVGSHQLALKQMALARGGLHCLGGNGAIAASVNLVQVEANILRNQTTDPHCISWLQSYLASRQRPDGYCPDSPLFNSGDHYQVLRSSPLVCPETIDAVRLLRAMTEKVLALKRLELVTSLIAAEHVPLLTSGRTTLLNDIGELVNKAHTLPTHVCGYDEEATKIYEATRQAALLFAHAVWNRRPLNMSSPCASCQTPVSPEKLYTFVKGTSIGELWGLAAGVFYWVFMIGAAASHVPSEDSSHTVQTESPSSTGYKPALCADLTLPLPFSSSPDHAAARANELINVIDQLLDSTITSPPPPRPNETPGPVVHRLVEPPDYSDAKQEFFDAELRTGAEAKRLFDLYARPRPAKESRPEDEKRDGSSPSLLRREDSAWSPPPSQGQYPDRSSSSKRHRVRDVALYDDQDEERARRRRHVHREYIRRYLTANAVRASMLLRFDHEFVVVKSTATLEMVVSWLREG